MPQASSGMMVVSRAGRFDGLAPAQGTIQHQVSPLVVQALAAGILQALANNASQLPVPWQPPQDLPQQQDSPQLERAKLRDMFD